MIACGHHYLAGHADVDGDGNLEMLLAGTNNCMGWKNGLAAVKLSPPLDTPGPPKGSATAPGDLFAGYLPDVLHWYVLLPEALCVTDRCVRINPDREVIELDYKLGGSEKIGFEGFGRMPNLNPSLGFSERRRHRRTAYQQVYHARRLIEAGSFPQALDVLRGAATETRLAGDDQLLEWVERLTAQTLAADGQSEKSEKIFQGLFARAASPADVAYDAATAFHLSGRLDLATSWYHQALTGDPMKGRFDYEAYFGLVLALAEMGSFETAHLQVERFTSPHQPLARAGCRAYVRWRFGEPLELPFTGAAPQGTYDLFRYWNLEFRRYLGEATPTLFPDVIAELEKASEEYRGLLRALRAELLLDLGQGDDALTLVREAHLLLKADLLKHPVARAHYEVVVRRRAAIERAAGREDEALRVEDEFRRWQAEQQARYLVGPGD